MLNSRLFVITRFFSCILAPINVAQVYTAEVDVEVHLAQSRRSMRSKIRYKLGFKLSFTLCKAICVLPLQILGKSKSIAYFESKNEKLFRKSIQIECIIDLSFIDRSRTIGESGDRLANVKAIRRVPREFLSLAFGTGLIRNQWGGIDWRKAVILTTALSPGYLRVGGANANFLIFSQSPSKDTNFDESNFVNERKVLTNFTITAGDLDKLHWFGKSSNLSVIFDLNVLLRTKDDQWDWRANAESLLTYVQKQKYDFHFELGNEPDLLKNFNRALSPEQLARDYQTLKTVLTTKFPFYSKSKIVGPSTSSLHRGSVQKYFREFLQHGGAQNVDALTFHQYYFDGRTATKEQFIDPAIMNKLVDGIDAGKQLIKEYIPDKPNFPLWLGETASAYGGGAPGLSDAFVAGFLWLDKLGLSALHGLDVVVRQTLFQNSYALLDKRTHPNPDYWLSLLHKQLVDQTVLKISFITSSATAQNYTRFYAHCSKNRTTVFGMNLLNESATITFTSNKPTTSYDYYMLSPSNSDFLSKITLLNGQPLTFDGFNIPTLKGVRSEKPLILPPKNIVFAVFTNYVNCPELIA